MIQDKQYSRNTLKKPFKPLQTMTKTPLRKRKHTTPIHFDCEDGTYIICPYCLGHMQAQKDKNNNLRYLCSDCHIMIVHINA